MPGTGAASGIGMRLVVNTFICNIEDTCTFQAEGQRVDNSRLVADTMFAK